MSSEGYHEPIESLSEETRDLHRAIVTLIEELEAVDWYQQRAEACGDPDLRAVLVHNRDEEVEHAMMTLEWIRRRVPVVDEQARKYLFSDGAIVDVERQGDGVTDPVVPGSLRIGTLRHRTGASTE